MDRTIVWPRKTREVQTRLIDSTIWNEFPIRDDDVFIATYPKSGTTWTQQIVAQLLFNGDPDLDVQAMSPWLDMRFPPRQVKLPLLEAQTHRRIIKTHLPVDALVFSPSAKYLYVARDGRDVVWSLYNHLASFTPETLERMNSVQLPDVPMAVPPPADIRQFWREWLNRDGYPEIPFWEHVRSWWDIRDLPNVRLVHFANLKRDLPGQIREIAAFLDLPVDESRWDAILEHCSFDWMKANGARVVPGAGMSWEGGATAFLHRGVNGRWSETLTAEDVAEYGARALQELGEDCAHWLATGERD